jgi:DnaJ-class molecular chaperone
MKKILDQFRELFKDEDKPEIPEMHKKCDVCDGLGLQDVLTECDCCDGKGYIKTPYKTYLDTLYENK